MNEISLRAQARDPILFYDEVELYASDLDDHGAVQMAVKARTASPSAPSPLRHPRPGRRRRANRPCVKRLGAGGKRAPNEPSLSPPSPQVRVMPTCWYALLRLWLRVDDVVVRLRETRLFCAFPRAGAGAAAGEAEAPPVVLRERQAREETFAARRTPPSRESHRCTVLRCAVVRPVGAVAFCFAQLCFGRSLGVLWEMSDPTAALTLLAQGLRARGAPASVAQYPDAETSSQARTAATPTELPSILR